MKDIGTIQHLLKRQGICQRKLVEENIEHITKANALRRRAKDKEDELKVVRKELSDTEHLLSDM